MEEIQTKDGKRFYIETAKNEVEGANGVSEKDMRHIAWSITNVLVSHNLNVSQSVKALNYMTNQLKQAAKAIALTEYVGDAMGVVFNEKTGHGLYVVTEKRKARPQWDVL